MRFLLVIFAAKIGCASPAMSQDWSPLADRMFCDYVADFAPQIARNRIRQVPFLRLDEFDYFDRGRADFLKETARNIYTQSPEELRRLLDDLADSYAEECHRAFNQD